MQSLCNYKFEKIWNAYHKYQDDLIRLICLLEELDDQEGANIAHKFVDDFNGMELRHWLGQNIENVEHPKSKKPLKNQYAYIEFKGFDFTKIRR